MVNGVQFTPQDGIARMIPLINFEKDIYKIPVPEELGEAPEYKPRSYDGGRRNFHAKGGRNANRGGGNAQKKGNPSKGRSGAPKRNNNTSGSSQK